MHDRPTVTRFAPSPTGYLHLGNARTALFSCLQARTVGGRFVVRIEDTDAVRNEQRMLTQVLDDLYWLGLSWEEGPDVGGPSAPYLQSERVDSYDAAVEMLRSKGLAYECFCTPEELRLSRRAQLTAGRAPRYEGTCAGLSGSEVQRRLDAGRVPAIRFRVASGRRVEFEDAIHAAQRFVTDDIGDFVIRRADGSTAFLLSNAIDDASMGINFVIRGDDHLANTPRQILLLEALGLPVPRYGHLPLILGSNGKPLSKRDGAASLHDLRSQGFLPGAIQNYLVRLGHACDQDQWLDTAELPSHFDLGHSSRSPAHFDEAQLRHWQREALQRATTTELMDWLGAARLERLGDTGRRSAFVEAVRGNLLFPADADSLLEIVLGENLQLSADAEAEITSAGPEFFVTSAATWSNEGPDFKRWVRATGSTTGCKGAALYMPLRSALTGLTHGPELAPLVAMMEPTQIARRLESARRRAAR
jgi:glutamyl-tRNA synthetase